jgi:hypothetical protein
MYIIPTKNATNAHKNMTMSSQKTSSHIPHTLSCQQKYDSCQLYNTSLTGDDGLDIVANNADYHPNYRN